MEYHVLCFVDWICKEFWCLNIYVNSHTNNHAWQWLALKVFLGEGLIRIWDYLFDLHCSALTFVCCISISMCIETDSRQCNGLTKLCIGLRRKTVKHALWFLIASQSAGWMPCQWVPSECFSSDPSLLQTTVSGVETKRVIRLLITPLVVILTNTKTGGESPGTGLK